MSNTLPTLSLLEARVLAVLVEKQKTVPDTYPLSLNSLVAGCNQKSSRDPVLNVTDEQVQAAVDHLMQKSLVFEGSGSRVTRYEHNMGRVMQLPTESVAMLATLVLRGPQTVGELRINCERLYKFADLSSVQAYLEQLRDRSSGGLVIELARKPGSREVRWAHLLSGPVAAPVVEAGDQSGSAADHNLDLDASQWAAMQANVHRLEGEVAQLKAALAKVCKELGIEIQE
jgi:uncharacterized protein